MSTLQFLGTPSVFQTNCSMTLPDHDDCVLVWNSCVARMHWNHLGLGVAADIPIFAGGPLTDIALAVRADPEFAGLVKELLFFGGARTLTQPDFNFRFDPEAAQIVMGANWPNIISVCDVTYGKSIKLEQSDLAKIGGGNTPIADYVANFSRDDIGTNNLWDEICAAILIDRSLITESRDAYIDVVVDPQKVDYGAVKVSCQNALIDGQSKVRIVTAFDYGRFKSLFVDSMIGPKPKTSSN